MPSTNGWYLLTHRTSPEGIMYGTSSYYRMKENRIILFAVLIVMFIFCCFIEREQRVHVTRTTWELNLENRNMTVDFTVINPHSYPVAIELTFGSTRLSNGARNSSLDALAPVDQERCRLVLSPGESRDVQQTLSWRNPLRNRNWCPVNQLDVLIKDEIELSMADLGATMQWEEFGLAGKQP